MWYKCAVSCSCVDCCFLSCGFDLGLVVLRILSQVESPLPRSSWRIDPSRRMPSIVSRKSRKDWARLRLRLRMSMIRNSLLRSGNELTGA